MLLSVIIPCYNVESSVRKTLDSLLTQNFTDYEIIAVNDGSKDSTLSILKEYETNYPLVKVIDKPNGGVSSARNKGLDVAKGDYIFFLDSDDYVYPNFFQTVTEEIKKKNNPGIIAFGFYWEKRQKDVLPQSTGINYFNRFLKGYENIMIWSYVARRSLYEDFRLRFDTTLSYAEDYHLFYRLFYLSQDIQVIKKAIIYYTDNANSAMHKKLSPSYLSSLESFVKLDNFFVENGETGFYHKAMRNIQIQNYLSLRRKYLAFGEKDDVLDSLFLKYRWLVPTFPPFQLSPFFAYNLIYTTLLWIKDPDFRTMKKS